MTFTRREAVLEALRTSPRGPLKPKELAAALRIPQTEYRDLRGLLRSMEEAGDLYRVRGSRYGIPEKLHLLVGLLRVTRGGDGFLRPEIEGGGEIYLPQRNHESAMDGDRVAVRIESRPREGLPVGRVVKVIERGRTTVVGKLHRTRTLSSVVPLNRRISRDIVVPQDRLQEARNGDIVVVRILQFGDRRLNPIGEVERVLGKLDSPGVDVLAVLHGHGLPAEFPTEVEEAATEASSRGDAPGPRTDRRDLLVFTIDPADARDHDDALSIVSVGEDRWEVGIHIADVSHFVEEGSPLDLEAWKRGTSVYLVDQVVPMLPHSLSSDLCSLRSGVDRLALSLFLEMDGKGGVHAHRFERTIIRSRYDLTYDQVQEVLEGKSSLGAQLDEDLSCLARLARGLRGRRSERGSLDFDLPEARVVLDSEGAPIDIQRRVQEESHRLIEDFMILANEVVAQESIRKKLPVPFRIHEPPSEVRMEELREFLRSIGYALPKGDIGPRSLQAVLSRSEGRPEAGLVSTVVLRSMNRARYDVQNPGHFGLASRAYSHFTSPIRRYPDLALHRVVARCLIEGEEPRPQWAEGLRAMTSHASDRERVAQNAERDSVDMKKVEFMARHLGEVFDGVISGVTSFGLFVQLNRYFVEGLVHIGTIGKDYYRFVPESHTLVGERSKQRFRLGDPVQVRVVRTDKEERKIDFLLS